MQTAASCRKGRSLPSCDERCSASSISERLARNAARRLPCEAGQRSRCLAEIEKRLADRNAAARRPARRAEDHERQVLDRERRMAVRALDRSEEHTSELQSRFGISY